MRKMIKFLSLSLALAILLSLCIGTWASGELIMPGEREEQLPEVTAEGETAVLPQETEQNELTGANEIEPANEPETADGAEETHTPESAGEEPDPALDGSEIVASGPCGDDLIWTLTADGVLTISGTGDMWDYTWNDRPGWLAWLWEQDDMNIPTIGSVIVNEGVEGIGEGIEFCEYSVYRSSSIFLPTSLKRIGSQAFGNYNYYGIEVVYAGTAEQWYGIDIASYNGALWEAVGYPLQISGSFNDGFQWSLNDGVLTLSGEGAIQVGERERPIDSGVESPWYSYGSVYSIVIEEGIPNIPAWMFLSSNIVSLTIPSTIKEIGDGAFDRCSALVDVSYAGTAEDWLRVSVGDYNIPLIQALGFPVSVSGEADGIVWSLELSGKLTVSGEGALTERLWSDYSFAIRTVVIESGITSIGPYAFRGCPMLEEVSIPTTVTWISEYAFDRTFDMENVRYAGSGSLPEGVLSAADPEVGLVTYGLPIGVVGQAYDVQLLAFDDEGYSRTVTAYYYDYDESIWESVLVEGMPDGLTLGQDGRIAGTPTESIDTRLSITVSWGVDSYTYDNIVLSVVSADELEGLRSSPDENARFIAQREQITVPQGESAWFRFVSPGPGININGYSAAGRILMCDADGLPIHWLWGGGGDFGWAEGYATNAGQEYYIFADAAEGDIVFSIGDSIQVELSQDMERTGGETIAKTAENVSKHFEGSEIGLWDVYTYSTDTDSDLGLLSWGWAWWNEELNIVVPYDVFFEAPTYDCSYGSVTDEELIYNDPARSASLTRPTVGEGETWYQFIQRYEISSPGEKAQGKLQTSVDIYVPAGKTLVWAGDAYRDAASAADVNGDGRIDPADAALLLSGKISMDINNDGRTDGYDALLLLQYAVGLIGF